MKLSQLEVLFGSRVRVKLLKVFLGNPDSAFHGRELQREIGEEHKAVWQELRDLEKVGFLTSRKEGKTKKYQLKKFSGWQTLAEFLSHPKTLLPPEEPQALIFFYLLLLLVTRNPKLDS